MRTVSQTAAMLEAAAQAKKIRDREMTKSKKPSTLKKVGSRVVLMFVVDFLPQDEYANCSDCLLIVAFGSWRHVFSFTVC